MPSQQFLGIGMTSRRTRERLVQRLMEKGIRNHQVLEVIRNLPRHIFVDEALSSDDGIFVVADGAPKDAVEAIASRARLIARIERGSRAVSIFSTVE